MPDINFNTLHITLDAATKIPAENGSQKGHVTQADILNGAAATLKPNASVESITITDFLALGAGANLSFNATTTFSIDPAARAPFRAAIGGTTVGQNLFTLANPGAITFLRINADNTVTALTLAQAKVALGIGGTAGNRAWGGAADTLVLADANKLVRSTGAVAAAQTVPTNAAVPFPLDTTITLFPEGAGQVTLSGAGVTFIPATLLKTAGQYKAITITKVATDTWIVIGGVA
jgi:hypothetical protein